MKRWETEGWSAAGDGGQAAISLTPDTDEMHVLTLKVCNLKVMKIVD